MPEDAETTNATSHQVRNREPPPPRSPAFAAQEHSLTEAREKVESQDALAAAEALNPQGILRGILGSQGSGALRSEPEDPLKRRGYPLLDGHPLPRR